MIIIMILQEDDVFTCDKFQVVGADSSIWISFTWFATETSEGARTRKKQEKMTLTNAFKSGISRLVPLCF